MIFGRSVGRIKESESDKQFHSKKDKFTITKGTQNQSNIRLVRLMFYLPNISKETDVLFFLDEVQEFYVSNNM